MDSKVADVSNESLRLITTAALAKVATHPHYVKSGVAGTSAPQVDVGCPSSPRITQPGFNPRSGHSDIEGIGVETPSVYRAFVFIVPQEQIEPLVGYSFRTVPQEGYCVAANECAAVTEAVYLAPSDTSDPIMVAREITNAVGLDANLLPASP